MCHLFLGFSYLGTNFTFYFTYPGTQESQVIFFFSTNVDFQTAIEIVDHQHDVLENISLSNNFEDLDNYIKASPGVEVQFHSLVELSSV